VHTSTKSKTALMRHGRPFRERLGGFFEQEHQQAEAEVIDAADLHTFQVRGIFQERETRRGRQEGRSAR
jgi:hypothetical protein